jgi:hypothetical protein
MQYMQYRRQAWQPLHDACSSMRVVLASMLDGSCRYSCIRVSYVHLPRHGQYIARGVALPVADSTPHTVTVHLQRGSPCMPCMLAGPPAGCCQAVKCKMLSHVLPTR